MQVPMELAETHYGEHQGKPFYNDLISFITSAPVFAMVVEGEDAVNVSRHIWQHQILQKLHQDQLEVIRFNCW